MSEEIVRRLMHNQTKRIVFLNESLNEEDEDMLDDTGDEPNLDIEDTEVDDTELSGDTEEIDFEPSEDEQKNIESPNPLDNPYAVRFKLGDPVALSYINGTGSEMTGIIEGYDKEGFYRIKWDNGHTTNGVTDICLLDLIRDEREEKCICGSSEFIQEGNSIVCDRCGRRIRESMDPLTLADKSRPKGKKLIRSEAHPTSTVMRPDISECIKNAFKKSIKEDVEEDIFFPLKELSGEFWTRMNELVEDIEDLGYDVLDSNSEYVLVAKDDYDEELKIPIVGTSRTMTLDLDKAKLV